MPFLKGDYCIAWQGSSALAWIWDTERVQPIQTQHGLDPEKVRTLPEELLFPPSHTSLRLIATRDGLLGQYWKEDQLIRSRWWPRPPQPSDWLTFQRDAGISPDEQCLDLPPTEHPDLSDTPWLKPGSPTFEGAALEKAALMLGALALALPTGWFGGQLYQLERATDHVNATLAEAQAKAGPILEARREALAALARIEELSALAPRPTPLELIASLAEALPRNEARLTDLTLQGSELKVTLTSPNTLSGTPLVNALLQRPELQNVVAQSSSDPKTITLTMTVKPR